MKGVGALQDSWLQALPCCLIKTDMVSSSSHRYVQQLRSKEGWFRPVPGVHGAASITVRCTAGSSVWAEVAAACVLMPAEVHKGEH